jgi:hypothetical protein
MSSATVGVGGRDVVLIDAAGAMAFDWFNAAGLSGHRGYMPFIKKLAPGASTTQVLWFVVPSPGDYTISIPPWPGVSDLGLTAKGSIRVH